MRQTINSVAELIQVIGGPKATSVLLGTTPQNVVNWRATGKIPARFHLVHRKALEANGYRVADTCWGFLEEAG
jgi:hypothetical protein